MDITIAYYHPLLHPEVVKRDFEQIRSAGAGSIVVAVYEQEVQRSLRDLERGLRQAQDMGLKVYLNLSRYGNLFAGPVLVPSWYTFHHPNSRVMDRHGRYHDISCFNHEAFRSWLFKEIEQFLRTLPINGIFIDEPRGPDITCFCSVCRALCPDVADLQRFRRRSFIDFLGDLCACVKRVDMHSKTTIALQPQDFDDVEELVTLPHLDMIAGHLFCQLLHEDVSIVEIWGRGIVGQAQAHKKRSQLWLQNFQLDKDGEETLEPVFTHLQSLEPDEIGCYYYWRDNERPTQVWQATRDLLHRIPRRQLYWYTRAEHLAEVQKPE
jgi:hypothetical protein